DACPSPAAAAAEDPEELFPGVVLAAEDGDGRLTQFLDWAHEIPSLIPVLLSGLGWVSWQHLVGSMRDMLASSVRTTRLAAIASSGMHRIVPGDALIGALGDDDAAVRTRAARTAGEVGRRDLLPQLVALIKEENELVRFWAAWSAALLGDRRSAPVALS